MTPTREQLAKELADRNGECGYASNDMICTRPKGHAEQHRGQPTRKVIPFQ